MTVQIQVRRDLAATWTSVDPVLAEGEIGFETDTFLFKLGDGATAWTGLGYAGAGSGMTNPMTTKGDVIVGDTGGSPIRKAVGSNGQVLTADSTATGGIKWATPSGGGGGLGLSVPVFARTVTGTGFSPNDVTLDISARLVASAAAQVTSSVVFTFSGAFYLTVWRNGLIQEQITVSSAGTTTITPFTPAAGDTIWMTVSNGGGGASVSGSLDIASGGWS